MSHPAASPAAEPQAVPSAGDSSTPAAKVEPALQDRRLLRLAPYALALACCASYAVLSVARYRRMATRSWDLGIFEQAIRNYAHLRAPIVDLLGPGSNLLGHHFQPILVTLAPLYRLFPSPVTLLMAQAALIAFSVVPITRLAIGRLGPARGVAVGIAYGISWGLQRAVDFDFHEIAFAVPILALALERLVREEWRAAACWSALLVFVKEDFGVTVAAVGAYLYFRRQRALGAALAGYGVAAFCLTVFAILPSLNSGGRYDFWGKLGIESGQGLEMDTVRGLLLTLPWHFVFPLVKAKTLFLLLLPTGFLALRSPLLLLALPTLAWRFVSNDDHYWGTEWHYSAALMPILFVAFIEAVTKARASSWGWLRGYAQQAVAVSLTVSLMLCASFPFRDLARAETYRPGPRAAAASQLLAKIPDGASVEANIGLLAQLTSRCQVLWIGNTQGLTPDFIALDLRRGWSEPPRDAVAYARRLHPGVEYEQIGEDQGYVLLRLERLQPRRGS